MFEPIERAALRDLSKIKPRSDEEFRSDKMLYSYDRTELEARVESVDESATVRGYSGIGGSASASFGAGWFTGSGKIGLTSVTTANSIDLWK